MTMKVINKHKSWKDLDRLLKFKTLWILDLSNNLIECVKGLREFVCLGGLDLSNNNLRWINLDSIKHLFIVDLKLHSNPFLESDAHYRHHVIDIFPRVFCLDSRFIPATERLSTSIFFDKSSFEKIPIRRHIATNTFRLTSSKSLRYYGKYSQEGYEFLRQFPDFIPLTEEWDKKKITYLSQYTISSLSASESDHGWIVLFTEKLLSKTDDVTNITELYILTTLLVANVEYGLKKEFIQEVLDDHKINVMSVAQSNSFFTLLLEDKLKTISVFLAILSIATEKQNVQKHFMSELYHAMNNLMWVQVRLGSGENIESWFDRYKNEDLKQIYWLSRSLLAAETFGLKSKFENVEDIKRYGLNDIIDDATGNFNFSNTVSIYKDLIRDQDIFNMLHSEIRTNIDGILTSYNLQYSKNTNDTVNRRTVSAKYAQRVKSVTDSLHRGQSNVIQSNKSTNEDVDSGHIMDIGDFVLLGSQMLARVLAVPESNSALVQVTACPIIGSKNSMKNKQSLVKIDREAFKWSFANNFWIPEDSVGDRIFIYQEGPDEELKSTDLSCHKKKSIAIPKIQVCKESILQEKNNGELVKEKSHPKSICESTIYSTSKNSSARSSPRAKRLMTPNSAQIFFSSSKNCLTIPPLPSSNYSLHRMYSGDVHKSLSSSKRIPKQTDATMWLGDGDYIYKKVWWHSANPNNIKKRDHRPGWLNDT